MTQPAPFAEIWRGAFLESVHSGHAVVCDDSGEILHAWGNPETVILPRSSAKMIQALPLVRSGAADAMGLGTQHLALACASHQAADLHTGIIGKWLDTMGLSDSDFRCGAAVPGDIDARDALIRAYEQPCQIHHECSGKHAGFLTVNKHLGGPADYEKPDHPVQKACLEAFEEVTGRSTFGYGIDGCSVPNFSTTLHGMARAMAHFAAAPDGSAEARLHQAMRLHPELVAGETRSCTDLMRAMDGKVAIKTGAEGFFIAILPEQKIGVALKAACGTPRAAACAIASILVKLGALDPNHPEALKYRNAPIVNRRDIITGSLKPAPTFA
ncbi:asparaginase [Sulfitobacter sp. CW3]|uniref:asparaginase n=1 Tax=Sulfitobacter sp. CW3 TaxID=2861965 RepID=UPI001C5FE1EC|nr:asparaginase [Sulfitobacter sp. CW3]MBW4962620.1 asparaginase [Sulfitobacter sp. CW3]